MTEKQVWMLTGDVYPETAGLKEARGTGRGTISDAGLTAGYTWRTLSRRSHSGRIHETDAGVFWCALME